MKKPNPRRGYNNPRRRFSNPRRRFNNPRRGLNFRHRLKQRKDGANIVFAPSSDGLRPVRQALHIRWAAVLKENGKIPPTHPLRVEGVCLARGIQITLGKFMGPSLQCKDTYFPLTICYLQAEYRNKSRLFDSFCFNEP